MAYSESLAQRMRRALSAVPGVQEKKMFGGLAFMVNGKMCLTVGPGRIMCRVDPALHDLLVAKRDCSSVIMRGRIYRGYVHISEDQLRTKAALDYWIALALEHNKTIDTAISSKARKR
ncbi:TfoX/Sxy family protein [Niabella sp. CC-SYL272]|uniref:TfoX/Sxy family protein n=1 Tax=Niabella agricola TaxID=2891571 RepID=UPI001F4799ED|nr:TfoX/Sxy family protein [Niabella agricola]MCF3111160.1 TfoX/Sxy family protein [Niabella agricola]